MEVVCMFCFFKHKTAYEMRISDWSSDVCSSDLNHDPCPVIQARDLAALGEAEVKLRLLFRSAAVTPHDPRHSLGSFLRLLRHYMPHAPAIKQIGRASCRERVCPYV